MFGGHGGAGEHEEGAREALWSPSAPLASLEPGTGHPWGRAASSEQVSVVAALWPWCFFLGVELKLEMILLLCDVLTK